VNAVGAVGWAAVIKLTVLEAKHPEDTSQQFAASLDKPLLMLAMTTEVGVRPVV